jgi:uncharacterized membrane protein
VVKLLRVAAVNLGVPDLRRSCAMSDEFGNTSPQDASARNAAPAPTYATAPPTAGSGLSDSAAGAIAYLTIIPAILFLVLDPYKDKPFVKFHAFQCLGLAVTGFCLGVIGIIPFLGWIILFLGTIVLFIAWILCILKASQGGAFKLPVIGKFAAEQSGYNG